jgi:autotransporter-associated beta strand protein
MRAAIKEGAIVQNQSADRSTYYRMLDNGADAAKAPVLGDIPLLGKLYASQDKAPAATTASAPAGTANFTWGADFDRANSGFYDDSYATGNSAEVTRTEGLTKSGSGELTVSGNNTYSGGTVVNAGTLNAINAPIVVNETSAVKGLESERDQKTYVAKLSNADPNQVARVLQNMFANNYARENNQNGALSGTVKTINGSLDSVPVSISINPAGNGTVGTAQISVDPVTHNLVVVADKETEKQIQGVLASIDGPAFNLAGDSEDVAVLGVGSGNMTVTLDTLVSTNGVILFTNANSFVIADSSVPLTMDFTNLGATIEVAAGTNAFGPAVSLNDNLVIHRFPILNVTAGTQPSAGGSAIKYGAVKDENGFTFNLHDMPLDSVLKFLSDADGLTIVEDVQPRGTTVTLTGNHLTQEEVLDQLNSQLNRNNYAAVRNGKTLTILSKSEAKAADVPLKKAPEPPPTPQPEILTSTNAFSTFSMNVSDVSYKLAEASLQKGKMPDAASIRSEEFINAFDYRDPEASAGRPVAFVSERARYPFAQNRDLLRFSIKTAASGRAANRPMNLVLLLDTSGSMERADRVAIIHEALRVLSAKLRPQDTVSVVTFARVARLWADGVPGSQAGEVLSRVGGITPEGGTNLEEAMNLAYQTALRHYLANGANRVVLLTDGAANLGNVNPDALKLKVESFRKQGIALDCFGIGWEDYDDSMLAELSGNGDGRYAFINTPEEATTEFASKLAGALQVAAQDVKVQVEFNPQRVTSWRQIGYAKHQLTKEQFRDNTVLAAEVAAQEAGNALYAVEIKPDGIGPVATVYVRYKIPGTMDVEEHSWAVPYDGNVPALEQSSPAMRLAGTASAFSEWLAGSPFAQEVTTDELLRDLSGVPQVYGADQRPKQLEWMIRQAKSLSGR